MPPHLSSCLSVYTMSRTFRSSSDDMKKATTTTKPLFHMQDGNKGFGHRSFSLQAPLVWNNLPAHYSSFSVQNTTSNLVSLLLCTLSYSSPLSLMGIEVPVLFLLLLLFAADVFTNW